MHRKLWVSISVLPERIPVARVYVAIHPGPTSPWQILRHHSSQVCIVVVWWHSALLHGTWWHCRSPYFCDIAGVLFGAVLLRVVKQCHVLGINQRKFWWLGWAMGKPQRDVHVAGCCGWGVFNSTAKPTRWSPPYSRCELLAEVAFAEVSIVACPQLRAQQSYLNPVVHHLCCEITNCSFDVMCVGHSDWTRCQAPQPSVPARRVPVGAGYCTT